MSIKGLFGPPFTFQLKYNRLTILRDKFIRVSARAFDVLGLYPVTMA